MALLILDFDGTLVQIEALEELAKISLASYPDRRKRIAVVEQLTEQAMKGELDFSAALTQRLDLLQARRSHIATLIARLKSKITPSFLRSFAADKKFWSRHPLFIVSGGFREYIVPIAAQFGIAENKVFANEFIINNHNRVVGYNERNPLAHSGGKVEIVRLIRQQSQATPVVILGDGWTDYEIREQGQADKFFVFTENVRRQPVVAVADAEAAQAEDIISLVDNM